MPNLGHSDPIALKRNAVPAHLATMAHVLHRIVRLLTSIHGKERIMPTTQNENDKKRLDPRTGGTGRKPEPQIPDVDPADLDDDQADSGPDRDHKELGG